MTVTMPNVVNLLNGMFSLIKYGLSDCNSGFSVYPGFGGCSDNGLFQRSFGRLFYEPTGADNYEKAADLALLLTAGRLSDNNLNTIVDACSTEPDQASITRCMQQLIVSTGEFASTSQVTLSGEDRTTEDSVGTSTEPYKAIVYFYLGGGLDSYNVSYFPKLFFAQGGIVSAVTNIFICSHLILFRCWHLTRAQPQEQTYMKTT